MTCIICKGWGENIGTPSAPVLVHRDAGACWEPFYHAYREKLPTQKVKLGEETVVVSRPLATLLVERSFKRMDPDGKLRYPWEELP